LSNVVISKGSDPRRNAVGVVAATGPHAYISGGNG
jgi:hypothetical protein